MKNKKPNAEQLWKHFEDDLVPRLRLSVAHPTAFRVRFCRISL